MTLHPDRKNMKAGITFSLILIVTAFLALTFISFLITLKDLPYIPEDLRNLVYARPTEIYGSDGTLVHRLGGRSYVSLEQISPFFLQAVLATEDQKFYSHSGIDKTAMLRATLMNFVGSSLQGASTITQQLSKYLFFTFQRTFSRKLKEMLISLQLEAMHSKDAILEAYCNLIYFGGTAYGIEDAAQQYFNKNAKDLNLSEAALLAGIINAPSNLNPFSHLTKAKARQKLVLSRMLDQQIIATADNERALQDSIQFSTRRTSGNDFIDYVIAKSQKKYGHEAVRFGGLRIYTTLDPALQSLAEKALEQGLINLDEKIDSTGAPLQGALVSVSVATGEIKAIVGARRYVPGGFNRAINSNRHIGSGIKPIVYLTALDELGYTPATVVYDTATTFRTAQGKRWRPRNFDRRYRGPLILKSALMRSINLISAQITNEATPAKIVATARRFGISSPMDKVLSISLGTAGVSPLEMAAAYAVIANQGIYYKPILIKRVEDINGTVLDRAFSFGEPRFDARTTHQLLNMMQGVIDKGTAKVIRRLGFKKPAAGKTGTSADFTDAWFNGFTTGLATSVWVGYDRTFQMYLSNGRGVDGAQGAAPIWAQFMKRATELYPAKEFPIPEGLRKISVNPETGNELEYAEDPIEVIIPDDFE